jgi:tetratricopeptide (TPR) repeat protein
LARELRELWENNPKASPTSIASVLYLLAEILVHNGKSEEAEPLLRECLQIRSESDANDRLIAETESLLGGCLTALGRFEEAESLLLESYPRIESAEDKPHDLTRTACRRIIELYDARGDPEKANEWRAKLASTP